MTQMGMAFEHPGPFPKGFPNQFPVCVAQAFDGRFQVPYPSMNELGRGSGSASANIPGVQNFNLPAPPGGRQSRPKSAAASAYNDYFHLVAFQSIQIMPI